jgi:hypothetical protein
LITVSFPANRRRIKQVMNGGSEELLGDGLALLHSCGQLVALRQQLVHLGDDALLFG